MRLLIDAIPTKPGGGLTVLLGLLRGWRQAGCELDILVLVTDEESEGEIASSHTVDRLIRVDAGRLPWSHFIWQNFFLGRVARRERADVVIVNNHYLLNVPCPQVVHHHNLWRFVTPDLEVPPGHGLTNRVRDANARMALRRAEANVFVSGFLRSQAERFEPSSHDRNHVIRNGLDDVVIDAALTHRVEYRGQPQIVAIQSANPHKDNPTMVHTLAALVKMSPSVDWRLKVAGSAGRSGWSDVQELAAQLNVSDRITWCGFCSVNQLDAMLRESLCLLATSVLEAGPLPVIEAMARHCVPVASSIAANVEFVDQAGMLVPARQPEQFARAILDLYHHPERRSELVQRGLEQLPRYRWSECARQFCGILEDVSRGRARPNR